MSRAPRGRGRGRGHGNGSGRGSGSGRGRGSGSGRGRGRGRYAPSPSPSRLPSPPSPWNELRGFEFFLPLYGPDATERKRLPPKFQQLLDGREPRVLKVREAGGGGRYRNVDVLYDGEGVMYLNRGWEQFARAHMLQQGHFLNFEFNGEDTLTVKVFDGTTYRRHYYVESSDEDEWSSTDMDESSNEDA